MRGNDYVASARLGDLEILHGEFTVSGGSAGELRLTIRGDSASVEGKVTLPGPAGNRGKRVSDAHIARYQQAEVRAL